MLIITIVIFLAILIVTHEFGHFITAKLFKLRVDEFAFGFPPKIFSKKVGDTTYSVNAIPFGGFVKLYGENEEGADPNEKPERSFYNQAAWKRAIIIGAGVVMNFIIGWFAISIVIFFSGTPTAVYVSDVLPGSPAAAANFMKGDKIEGFNNKEEFISYVNAHKGEEIVINGKTVTPRINPPPGEGSLGVLLADGDFVKPNPFRALVDGFVYSITLIKEIYFALGNLIAGAFGGGKVLDSLTGPVGIFNEIDKASNSGFIYLVQLLAILSLNLAVFNLLPFPALDGGRLFFILIEKIIGKRMNVKYEAIANLVGFGLLMLLAITVTVHDIYKLVS